MSVSDLQNSLEKVAQRADGLSELLSKFETQNGEDLVDVQKALEGTKTSVSDETKRALNDAASAIRDAKKSVEDAAAAARDYANSI